jgi:hypothetical protein
MKSDKIKVKKLTIQVEFYEISRALALLRSLTTYSVALPIVENRYARAVLSIDEIQPVQSPRIEVINGRECVVFRSKM